MRNGENIMRFIAIVLLTCVASARAADSTKVALPAAGNGEIAVEVTNFDPERCLLTMAPKDGVLVLNVATKAKTGFFRKGCEAGFKVTAPAAPPAKVEAGARSTLFDGLSGRVQEQTEAGNASLVKS